MLEFYLHLPERFWILPSSSLQVSAILQVKLALVYFANFHKHAGEHRETHRTHLRMHSCTHAHTHTHTHTHTKPRRLYEYSTMTLTARVFVLQQMWQLIEHTSSPWMYTQTSTSCNNVIRVSASHFLDKFTTMTGGLCHLTLQWALT